jgi:hypothetical protein
LLLPLLSCHGHGQAAAVKGAAVASQLSLGACRLTRIWVRKFPRVGASGTSRGGRSLPELRGFGEWISPDPNALEGCEALGRLSRLTYAKWGVQPLRNSFKRLWVVQIKLHSA